MDTPYRLVVTGPRGPISGRWERQSRGSLPRREVVVDVPERPDRRSRAASPPPGPEVSSPSRTYEDRTSGTRQVNGIDLEVGRWAW